MGGEVEDPGIRLWREVARQSLHDFELTKRGRESSAVPSSRVSNSSADPNSRYSGSFVRDWSPTTSVSSRRSMQMAVDLVDYDHSQEPFLPRGSLSMAETPPRKPAVSHSEKETPLKPGTLPPLIAYSGPLVDASEAHTSPGSTTFRDLLIDPFSKISSLINPGTRTKQGYGTPQQQEDPIARISSGAVDSSAVQCKTLEELSLIKIASDSLGPKTLEELLAYGSEKEVESAVADYFDWIANDQYEWIRDLRDAGYGHHEIALSLMENVAHKPQTGWKTPDSANSPTHLDAKGLIASPETIFQSSFHQPGCVHIGPDTEETSSKVDGRWPYSPSAILYNLEKVEGTRREVEEYCGLAGVFPQTRQERDASFESFVAKIEYGRERGPHFIPSLMKQIVLAVESYCRAIKILQENGFCCDSITILVADHWRDVKMVRVPLSAISSYQRELRSIYPLFDRAEFSLDDDHMAQQLNRCADIAERAIIYPLFVGSDSEYFEGPPVRDKADLFLKHLNSCSLTNQILGVSILSYAEAHTGEFWPSFLNQQLRRILLEGCAVHPYPKLRAEFSYRKLACMSEPVGGDVFVLQFLTGFESHGSVREGSPRWLRLRGLSEDNGAILIASTEDIIDSWGPGVLLSAPHSPYGQNIKAVMIGGGIIAQNVRSDKSHSIDNTLDRSATHHWGQLNEAPEIDNTFSIRQPLRIGAILAQLSCPLDLEKSRRASEPYMNNLGTEDDYWRLAERQAMLQGGQYIGLQVGHVYNKMKGRPLKMAILDRWRMMPDFRILLQPWGLQVSVCTGVARRVPLKDLIEEPMFSYIDALCMADWHSIKDDVQMAFKADSSDFLSWTGGLQGAQKECLIKVVTFFLELLKDTGLHREGQHLRILWPHETSLFYAISLKCDKSNLWARVLKDTPSCATFAVVTGTCLEAPGHKCKRNSAAIWTGQGALLATAVSRVLVPGTFSESGTAQWELKNGQQCWIEKAGGDIWVYTTKEPNSDTQLRVKINRFPKGLSIFRDWQVLRERQDAAFEAEEVVVFGTMS